MQIEVTPMIILPILLLIIFAYFYSRYIKENAIILYTLGIFFATLSIAFENALWARGILNGNIGLALLYIVMITGVIPSSYKLKKDLLRVRKIYALLGFIFITPHVFSNILESMQYSVPIELFGLFAFLLIIPLAVTAVSSIRQTIKTSTWIKIHRISYIVYLAIFFHLIAVADFLQAVLYTILFIPYIYLRIYSKTTSYRKLKAISVTILIGSISSLFIYTEHHTMNEDYNIIEGNEFSDGLYTGTYSGFRGIPTEVRVLIYNNEIEYIIVDQCGCTDQIHDGHYAEIAFEMSNDIQFENRTDIDSISGATKTSNGIRQAVINALEQAIIE